MSNIGDLAKPIDMVGEAFDAFRTKSNDKLDAIKASQDELTARIEEIESGKSAPGKTKNMAENREHLKRFEAWFRNPHDSKAKNDLSDFEHLSGKSVSVASNAGGGYAVQEEISRQIENLELKYSPVRRLVRVSTRFQGFGQFARHGIGLGR